MPEAVSITDLEHRGFSLDRDFVTKDVIEARIQTQMQRLAEVREHALVSRFKAIQVTDLAAALPDKPDDKIPDQAEPLFDLVVSPVYADNSVTPPIYENLAHCHIVSRRKRSPSILKKIRHDFLLPILQALISIDQFYVLTALRQQTDTRSLEAEVEPDATESSTT